VHPVFVDDLGRGNGAGNPGLVVDHFPVIEFQPKKIGCDQSTFTKILESDNVGRLIADIPRRFGTSDLRRTPKNSLPASHDRFATANRLPPRMDTGDVLRG